MLSQKIIEAVVVMTESKQFTMSPCPYNKSCFVCTEIGQYLECPLTLRDRIYVEMKEGGYEGLDPYTLIRRARLDK